ncbi:MAG: peptidoglycan/LPS O-acetylase OafA/YrhL [Marivirga sp.]|jgi:peptidoglycan/LPS O-acetylase OafA/YrhL
MEGVFFFFKTHIKILSYEVRAMLKDERVFLKPLTGIRAIAAFLVFLYHYNIFVPQKDKLSAWGIIDELHIGVTLFFVLSGFLITYRYYDRHHEIFTKRFYIKRFARIYPLFFILTSLTYIHLLINGQSLDFGLLRAYLLNISLLSGFFNELKFSGIPQAWSLTVEELFYLSTPILFFFLKKKLSNAIIICLSLLLLGGLFIGLGNWFTMPYGFFDSMEFMLTYTFFGRCLEFIIGMLLAIFYLKNKVRLLRGKYNYKSYLGLFATFGSVLLLVFLSLNGGAHQLYYKHLTITFLLPVFGIAPLYLGLITEKTIIASILSSKLFQLLGKASYAFYLIHLGFIASFLANIIPHTLGLFIVLNILAILLYLIIEQPLNKRIKLRFKNKNSL